MIPVCLVTGFLGSGKTTLLSKIVQRYRERKFVYLVNEFSPIDIDGQRLAIPPEQLVSIAGGSIFCRCLVGDFVRALQAIETHFGTSAQAPEGVIIEGSGVADPNVIQQLLHETKLDHRYGLQQIVTLVEPGSFLKLIHTLPNIIRQVESSALVLINKTDLYEPAFVEQTEQQVRRINPRAEIIPTTFCDLDFDPFAPRAQTEMAGDYALCRDPNYSTVSVIHDTPLDWGRLKAEIEAIPGTVYRVKGFVLTPSGALDVDFASGHWNEKPLPHLAHTELVLIVEGAADQVAHEIIARIKLGNYNWTEPET